MWRAQTQVRDAGGLLPTEWLTIMFVGVCAVISIADAQNAAIAKGHGSGGYDSQHRSNCLHPASVCTTFGRVLLP
jgi:hypothetical protein